MGNKKRRPRSAAAWVGSVLLGALLLAWCMARRPVAVDPDYVYAVDCAFEDGSVAITAPGAV